MWNSLSETSLCRILVVALGGIILGSVVLGGVVSGCGGSAPGDGGDAGSELDAIAAEERAACAHLFALGDACDVVAADEAECVAGLERIRVENAEPDCLPEHRAWVACVGALTDCSTEGSGVLCPMEYSALGLCAR